MQFWFRVPCSVFSIAALLWPLSFAITAAENKDDEIATKMAKKNAWCLNQMRMSYSFLDIYKASDVCAVCDLGLHFYSPYNNHIVSASIYGDTVIKLKQEHVVVAQNKIV